MIAESWLLAHTHAWSKLARVARGVSTRFAIKNVHKWSQWPYKKVSAPLPPKVAAFCIIDASSHTAEGYFSS